MLCLRWVSPVDIKDESQGEHFDDWRLQTAILAEWIVYTSAASGRMCLVGALGTLPFCCLANTLYSSQYRLHNYDSANPQ